MCGRFALTSTPEAVETFLDVIEMEDFPPRYNIAPTQPILMVTSSGARPHGSNLPERRAVLVRWGFIPAWAKAPKELPLLINARGETAAEKASFRAAMRHRRTLVPASGFYEWRRAGRGRAQPFWVRPRDGGLIAFAGLMETWSEPGGSEIDTGAIVTTAASSDLASIHHRMPVVIRREHFSRWLDCMGQEPRDVADLLRPAEPGFFEASPVSDKVNKVSNVDPDLQEPVEETSSSEHVADPEQLSLL
ncbi:SOS response-associated peptidase [Chelativorans sp. YIM 93263]|uniref:SOS response-associated peptidase n=1 Tax=Chelativorans sp. YIM 93263 TaxID=2906648 RepID=UPI002379A282|nr:SOS response-associated peptidase [Chelativorans sp. YIM 93263]